MPRTHEASPVAAATPISQLGERLPPALFAKLLPLAGLADVEQLLDAAADLEHPPHRLPALAAYVRRLALALADVRATVRARLGPPPSSRLPNDQAVRYGVTAAGLEALTEPDAHDLADTCPATLPLELMPHSVRRALEARDSSRGLYIERSSE
jgi:hypothetical protein